MEPEQRWIEAYRTTLAPLWAYALRRAGGSRELAEDAVQEAWLRAVDRWSADGFPAEPLAWLQTVTRNLLADHFRRARPESLEGARLDGTLEGRAPDAAAPLLQWALGRLPAREARLVEGFHLDGRDYADLARAERLTVRAVEGRLRRARERLRRLLAPHFQEDP